MKTDPGVERRLTRLENDRDALYELIDEFKAETRARFDAVDARFDAVDARFGSVETRLGNLEAGVTEILRRLPEAG